MQKRTFIRIMLDLLLQNAFVKSVSAFVNFCYEYRYYDRNKLKFLKNVPINKLELDRAPNKFLFRVNK